MENLDKPTTSLNNTTRAASYETWATILTSWATETRTWAELASLMDNITKATPLIVNQDKP